MMDPSEFWGIAGAALVVAAVQVIKFAVPDLTARWQVIAAAVFALAVELGIAQLTSKDLGTGLFMAFLVWLVSMGAWSGQKAIRNM